MTRRIEGCAVFFFVGAEVYYKERGSGKDSTRFFRCAQVLCVVNCMGIQSALHGAGKDPCRAETDERNLWRLRDYESGK